MFGASKKCLQYIVRIGEDNLGDRWGSVGNQREDEHTERGGTM